ncbi:MAG: hypothetical protein V4689_16390 [Verrucomicrobiota bacterium]
METHDDLRKLAEAHSASPEALAEAENALARADQHPRRRYWRIALYLTTLLVSLPVLVHSVGQVGQFAGTNHFSLTDARRALPFINPTGQFTVKQKLILFGDERAANEAERWKSLWQSEAENPSYFMEYAAAYFRVRKTLSPEILETAARIDPENAWYPTIMASAMAKQAVRKQTPGAYARKRGEKTTYTVTDEKQFASALELFHEAARKPRLSPSQVELQKQRIALLPERTDFVSQFPRQVFAASQNCPLIDLRSLVDAISVEAGRCAERKDIAGFQQLVADWRWLVLATAKDGVTLLDLMVAKAFFTMPLSHFSEAAKSLGLEEDVEKFARLHQQNEERRERVRRDPQRHATTNLVEQKASVMTGLTLTMASNQVDSPPPITEAGLLPGRFADHALFGRVHALASWAILGIGAGLAAFSSLSGSKSDIRLSKRLQDLVSGSDWLRILCGGILIPLLWYFAVTRLTPFSAREWGMKPSGFLLPATQLGSLTILMLVASAVIASGRLATRAGFLGLKPRLPLLGRVAVASAALAIPVVGAIPMIRPLGNVLFYIGSTLTGAALLWLVWGFFCHALGKPPAGSVRRATQARMMVPAWVFGMLVFALLVPIHYAEERQWIQQDRLLEITAESPAMNRYERDLTAVLRKELLEKLD